MIYNYFKLLLKTSLLILTGSQLANAQIPYTFTNCSATGGLGPTQVQANAAYASTNLSGQVTVTAGIQYWQVPATGKYTIEAIGAKGGGTNGGKGARMIGEFNFTAGQTLKILVGQQGVALLTGRYDYSGGGGSFVTDLSNNPLVVAGGGGGAHALSTTADGTTGTAGMDGGGGHSNGFGGTGGLGGTYNNQTSDGGAGFTGNGASGNPSPAPQSFINGGQGGCNSWSAGPCANGGFGGGGGTNRNDLNWWACGGGGGYSGGGAGYGQPTFHPYAGGGGSFNSGTNQINTSGYGTGDGMVVIKYFPSAPNDAGLSNIISPTNSCVGTYPVTAKIYNAGTNQIANVTVNWSIDGIAQAPYVHSTLLDTAGGTGPNSAIVNLGNITVSAGITYNIKAWTLNPNGLNDTVNANDTTLRPITGYAFPTINLGPDVSICPEDSITFDAGTGRDSLLWSTSDETQTIRVNTPGQYFVGVFKNGCESRDTVNLTHYPGAPDIDFGPDTIICSDDSLILDATQPGVTYSWQDGSMTPTFTVKNVGNYWVNIEDANGCKNGDTIKVVHYAEPTIFLTVSPGNSICYGVPFTFTALAASQGSKDYQWKVNGVNSGPVTSSNTFSPTLNYGDSVMVDLVTDLCADGGTRSIPSQWITMSINPQPKFINGPDTVLESSQDVYAVSLSPTSSYSWSVVGGTISGSSTGNTVTVNWGLDNDTAKVICEETDNKNCTYSNVKKVVVASIIGINESGERISMGYPYPNPAHSNITIPLSGKGQWEVKLELYDITGKMVKPIYNGEIRGNKQITFDVDELKDGMYFCKITTSDGHELVRKISIQR